MCNRACLIGQFTITMTFCGLQPVGSTLQIVSVLAGLVLLPAMDKEGNQEPKKVGQQDGVVAPSMQQPLHDTNAVRGQHERQTLHVLPKAAQALYHIALPPRPQLFPPCQTRPADC